MTESIIKKIGQPFATFNNNNMNSQGIGLGLSICKRLIGLLGPESNFEVRSSFGDGSIFSFKIYHALEKNEIENKKHFENRKKNFFSQTSKDKFLIENDEEIEENSFTISSKKEKDNKRHSFEDPQLIFDEKGSDEKSESKFIAYNLSNNINIETPEKLKKIENNDFVKLTKKSFSIDNLSLNRKSYYLRKKKNLASMEYIFDIKKKNFGPKLPKSRKTFENSTVLKQKMNILIIDDIFFNLIILEDILKRNKAIEINVIKEADGFKAIEIFKEKNKIYSKEKNIEIIFCDLEMQILSGYEVCRKIKDYCSNNYFVEPFIVAYSCDTSNEVIEKCLENQFDEIMNKPATFNELSELVCEIHEVNK